MKIINYIKNKIKYIPFLSISFFLSFFLFLLGFFMDLKVVQFLSYLPLFYKLWKDKNKIHYLVFVFVFLSSYTSWDLYCFVILYYGFTMMMHSYFDSSFQQYFPFYGVNHQVQLKKKTKVILKSIQNVKVNDILIVDVNDIILTDVLVMEGKGKAVSIFQQDMKSIRKNMVLESGYRNLDQKITVKVLKEYKECSFYKKEKYLSNLTEDEATISKKLDFYSFLISVLLIFAYLISYLLVGHGYPFFLFILLFIHFVCFYLKRGMIGIYFKLFEKGIYLKNKDALLNLSKVKTAFFDKSGVVTTGEFRITKIVGENKDDILMYLNYGEAFLDNKIAEAVKKYKSIPVDLSKVKNHQYIESRGITYKLEKHSVVIGNQYFLKGKGIVVDSVAHVGTILYVAVDKKLLGYVVISDAIKRTTKKNLDSLHELGLENMVLLSGDNTKIVGCIANEIGIHNAYSNATGMEKVFWYIYNRDKYKGKTMYVKNLDFDKKLNMADVNISFCKTESFDFSDSDILMQPDLAMLVKLFRYAKNGRDCFYKNLLLATLFLILDVILLCFNCCYFSIMMVLTILMFIILFYKENKI